MPSSTSLMPSLWPANTVEALIRLRCRQSRPQAVTRKFAIVERMGQLGQAAARAWWARQNIDRRRSIRHFAALRFTSVLCFSCSHYRSQVHPPHSHPVRRSGRISDGRGRSSLSGWAIHHCREPRCADRYRGALSNCSFLAWRSGNDQSGGQSAPLCRSSHVVGARGFYRGRAVSPRIQASWRSSRRSTTPDSQGAQCNVGRSSLRDACRS